jgi:hypothetical protein
MSQRHGISTFALAGLSLVAAGALFLAGCASFDVGGAIGKQIAPAPAPEKQNEPAPAPEQQKQSRSSGAGMAYQYQFGAFYGGFWSMGAFGGYKDGNYKPGQGTVWTFTGTDKKSSEPMTLERALLKQNADSSQWWRFKMDTGKDTILYEFLVGADTIVKKVRYKDPDTGTVEEFVPSQDRPQPPTGPAPRSREEMAKYKVDKQTVKVKAGTFATDHYVYTDERDKGTAESWVSATVPGGMVKSVYTSKKDNKTMTGELVQIESGVTTVLGSF